MVDDIETPKKFIIKNIQATKHSKHVNQLAVAKNMQYQAPEAMNRIAYATHHGSSQNPRLNAFPEFQKCRVQNQIMEAYTNKGVVFDKSQKVSINNFSQHKQNEFNKPIQQQQFNP